MLGVCASVWVSAYADIVDARPGRPSRTRALAERLKTDRSFKIRVLAAQKLRDLARGPEKRDPVALAALRLGLEDRSPLVRAVCVRALGDHLDHGALPALEQLGRYDPDPTVRAEARRARARIARAPRPTSLRVALGSLSLLGHPEPPALQARLSEAVEDHIGRHRQPIMSREDPRLRMDVQVERTTAPGELRYEVRVVLLELPKSHLRHTSRAVARAAHRGPPTSELEARVALEAVSQAVQDALSTAIASR